MKLPISKNARYFGLSLLLVQLFISCAVNPVTGKKELSFLSYDGELRLGRQADRQIVASFGLYDDPEVSKYVEDLGQMMARISHRPFLEFHFRVLDTPVVNAFALPGGYVYITRGILAYINSEAELAGVMGHEIGHVTARHSAKQYTRGQLAQIGFGVGSIFLPQSALFNNAAQFGVGLLFLQFSRDQERQADSLGVEYSSRIGYDATQMSKFFGTLKRLEVQSGQEVPGWFSTHPDPEDREVATLRMTKRWQKALPPFRFKVERNHYLDAIDGIVFGDEPRRGIVENGYFYYPASDLQFPVPEGWQVTNRPQEVQILSPTQTAGIRFSRSQSSSASAAAADFGAASNVQVLSSNRTRINGFNTEIREALVARQQDNLQVLAYFIEKDGRVFVFQAFSTRRSYNKYLSTFKHTMDNFDRLRNQAVKRIRPVTVKVMTVQKSTTLKEFLAHYSNNKLSPTRMAILNGMHLKDRLQPGDRVKVLVR